MCRACEKVVIGREKEVEDDNGEEEGWMATAAASVAGFETGFAMCGGQGGQASLLITPANRLFIHTGRCQRSPAATGGAREQACLSAFMVPSPPPPPCLRRSHHIPSRESTAPPGMAGSGHGSSNGMAGVARPKKPPTGALCRKRRVAQGGWARSRPPLTVLA